MAESKKTEVTALVLPEITREIAISPDWLGHRDSLIENVQGITIENEVQFNAGADLQSAITKHSNALEKVRKDWVAPLTRATKQIKALADAAREPLEAIKAELKAKMSVYAEEQRRIEREARIEAERKAQEEIERQVAEQESAKDIFGDDAVADVAPVEVPVEAVAHRAVASSARVVESVVWEVVDADKIPRRFLTLDPRKVNEYRNDNKARIKELIAENGNGEGIVEGIVFKIETDVRSR